LSVMNLGVVTRRYSYPIIQRVELSFSANR
jgi:hypothetical protein